MYRREYELRTQKALLATAIAVRRFQKDNQQLPGKLEELVPDYVAQLPADQLQVNSIRLLKSGDSHYLTVEPFFAHVGGSAEAAELSENRLKSERKDVLTICVDSKSAD